MENEIEYIPAKTLVTAYKPSPHWFEYDYNMNIYRGCCHGCIYCDSRSDCYRIEDFDRVRAKENALQIINHDLLSKRKSGIVASGSMSDPYNPFEEKLRLTRGALELFDRYLYGAAIFTKSNLIARDADILSEISSHSSVFCCLSITCASDDLSLKIEPNAPPSSARFAAVRALSDAGIYVGVLLAPILPFITDDDENIRTTVKMARNAGAAFVYSTLGVTLRANQRQYYYDRLDELFPGLKYRYIRGFGNKYFYNSRDIPGLQAIFAQECAGSGMVHKMRDIVRGYRKSEPEQLSFFR